jgi:hypothetical protein
MGDASNVNPRELEFVLARLIIIGVAMAAAVAHGNVRRNVWSGINVVAGMEAGRFIHSWDTIARRDACWLFLLIVPLRLAPLIASADVRVPNAFDVNRGAGIDFPRTFDRRFLGRLDCAGPVCSAAFCAVVAIVSPFDIELVVFHEYLFPARRSPKRTGADDALR